MDGTVGISNQEVSSELVPGVNKSLHATFHSLCFRATRDRMQWRAEASGCPGKTPVKLLH